MITDPSRFASVIWSWSEFLKQPPPSLELGSDLYNDGRASPVHQVAHASWAGIVGAVDPLHAVQALLTSSGVVHTYAPFALIRASLENAAVATWLLGPDDPSLRLTRVLHLAHENIRQDQNASAVVPKVAALPRNPPLEVRRREVVELAQSLNLDVNFVRGRFSYEQVVRRAAEHADVSPDLTVYLWKLCSGHAHGRQWASFHSLKQEVQPSGVAGVDMVRFSTDPEQVMLVAGSAIALNGMALVLYERRRVRAA